VGAWRYPDRARLAGVALVLLLADGGSQLAGDSVFPGGPLDETAHLATMVLVLWALGPRISPRLWFPALIASVVIDADHIPALLGVDWLTVGTPRPYTHSVTTVLVLLALGATAGRRSRVVWRGAALGLSIHLFRDLAEPGSGVALLWPLSDHSFSIAHWLYLMVMAGTAGVVAGRVVKDFTVGQHRTGGSV
jgi:hypothetical protein